VSKVEEALNLSPESFKAQYSHDKPSSGDELIFHCKLGGRAQKGADKAVELGFTKLVFIIIIN
jgi:rhodanese-related sulfurtransferase